MHVRGHDSNHAGSHHAVLEAFPDGVPQDALAGGESRRGRSGRLGNGEVQRAIARALSAAERPLRLAEILGLVEADLGFGVSRDSVKCCLTAGVRGSEARFERAGRGLYALSRSR